MGDSAWMRLLPGQRCRTPVSVWLPHDSTGSEESLEETTKSAPRPRANFNQSTLDFSKDVVIRETDRLQIAPSVDEMADMLRTTIMVSPTPPILGPQYTSYVLHLIEGYNKLRNNLSKKETEVAQLQTVRQEDEERSQSLVSDWSAQEARYKAEIKRLEKIIYQISGNGVEAVALARSGSLVRRGAKYRGLAIAATTTDTISEKVAEEDFCHDGYGDSDPCSQGADSQGRRTSISSDVVSVTNPLSTKRQLWRHRSESNLLERTQRVMAAQKEHRYGQVLSHLASPRSYLAMDTAMVEPQEECAVYDEERLVESDESDDE